MIRQTNMITTQIIINSSLPVSIYDCNTNEFSLFNNFRQISGIFLKNKHKPLGCLFSGRNRIYRFYLYQLYASGRPSVLSRHFFSRIAQILPHLVSESHKVLKNCRMPGGNIVLLAYIVLQIK